MKMSPPNGSEGCLRRPMSSVSGLNLLVLIVWYRGKAKINHVLHHQVSTAPPIQCSNSLSQEIIEIIISHLTHNVQTLKACSLTCHSWYIATFPYLHRTLSLSGLDRGLKALSDVRVLGLSPFTEEIRILKPVRTQKWFLPRFFGHWKSRHFFAFTGVQSLTLQDVDIFAFIPRLKRYFGHLSPTLRSLTLYQPCCTPLQLSHFISLFPNLDDITIGGFDISSIQVRDEMFIPFSAPKLGGRLVLASSDLVGTWEHLAASCGLRFRSIQVSSAPKCLPLLLAACAKTLETLRIEPPSSYVWYHPHLVRDCNLSQLKVLKSLQIKTTPCFLAVSGFLVVMESIFRTIKSSVFSKLTFLVWFGPAISIDDISEDFLDTLRRMYAVRPFKLEFLVVIRKEQDEPREREWERWVNAGAGSDLWSFLGSPPSVSFVRSGVE